MKPSNEFMIKIIRLFLVSVAPKVFLSFGQNLVPEDIEEGNDVYFECEVHSNPKVYKIIWLHNVSKW